MREGRGCEGGGGEGRGSEEGEREWFRLGVADMTVLVEGNVSTAIEKSFQLCCCMVRF